MARNPEDTQHDEPLRGAGHLDDLELDLLRAGEGNPEAAAHAESCDRCRAALAALRKLERDLAAEARALGAKLGRVCPATDRAVLARATAEMSRRGALRSPTFRRLMGSRWASAAALLVVVSGLAFFLLPGGGSVPGDVDGDGRVDIVDAYALALRIGSGDPTRAAWDQNGDGAIDERDVDALARESVSLSRWRGQ